MAVMDPGANGGYVSPAPPRPPGGSGLKWLGVLVGFAVLVGVVVLQRHTGNAPAAAIPATTATPTPISDSDRPQTASSVPTSGKGSTPPANTSSSPRAGTGGPDLTTVGAGSPQPSSGSAEDSSADSRAVNMPTIVTTVPATALARSVGWQIVGYGSGRLVRIDPATGRVIVHPGTLLGTENSPQSLISTAGRTYVGGWGSPGWIVPDGQAASIATGELYDPSQAVPGPDSGHLWIASAQFPGALKTVTLVDWDGHPTGTKITVPSQLSYGSIAADGAGYVLGIGIGGYYELTPSSTRLVTHGVVEAVGRTGFLVYECGDTPQCQAVVIDRASWSRRVIPGLVLDTSYSPIGVISADGRRAAMLQVSYTDNAVAVRLQLVDLTSGRSTMVAASMDPNAANAWTAQFSPDGKHLAVVLEGGVVGIVDAANGTITPLRLPPSAPPLTALTTRSG